MFWIRFQRSAVIASVVIALAGAAGAWYILHRAPTPQTTNCVVADVSGSTGGMADVYEQQFALLAQRTAAQQGRLCVVVAAGNPLGAIPLMANLQPVGANSLDRSASVASALNVVQAQFAELLRHPPPQTAGSALLEAGGAASRYVSPGGELEYLSDGIQASPFLDVHWANLSTAGIQTILSRLTQARLMASLPGVAIVFPDPLADADGRTHMTASRQAGVAALWQAWATQAGATLQWG